MSNSAAEGEVRSAYRRQALATHPDKGGTPEAFRLVVAAFETLTDPVRRAAYDQQLARKAALETRRGDMNGPSQGSKPTKRPRDQGERREPKKARGHDVRAADNAAASSPGAEQSPQDPSHKTGTEKLPEQPPQDSRGFALRVQELLGLSQGALRARVKRMSEEFLRDLLKALECYEKGAVQVAGACSSDSSTQASDSEAEPSEEAEPMLAICHVPSGAPEEDGEDANEGAVGEKSKEQGSERKLLRGICRNKRDCSYQASVGFKGVGAYSQSSVDLHKIIDMHISMVRMRQRFYEHLAAGHGFKEALSDAVAEMHSARAASEAPAIRLRFRCSRTTKSSNRRLDLEEVVPIWESEQAALVAAREERQRRRSEMQAEDRRKQEEREEQARQRAKEHKERKEDRLRRAEERRRTQEARRRVREEQAEARAQRRAAAREGKLEFLRHLLQGHLQRVCTQRERALQKAWGVKVLPEGVALADLEVPGLRDCVRAELYLKDGKLCSGPLRKELSLAKKDFKELSAIQRQKGDGALEAEVQRRELDAMTAFFVAGV